MKIEPGKYYKTRCGKKAWIGHICPEESNRPNPVYGYIVEDGNFWAMYCWHLDGKASNCDYCLVSEWTEPEKKQITIVWNQNNGAIDFRVGTNWMFKYPWKVIKVVEVELD